MSLQDRLMNGRIKAAQDKSYHERWCSDMKCKIDGLIKRLDVLAEANKCNR